MDQTDDQQVTNQNQGMPVVPAVQPQTPASVMQPPVQPTVPTMQDAVTADKLDLSTQQDINPDDLRNKLNETLQQPSEVSVNPVTQVAPVEPVTTPTSAQEPPVQTENVVSEQHIEEKEAVPSEASVVVYAIANCPFCKAEKDYLTAHKIAFEERLVDSSEANLKEMLALSDNFAGVPVTHLKGASSQRVVKGFTEAEFAQELVDVGFLKPEEAPTVHTSEPSIPEPAVTVETQTEQTAEQPNQEPVTQPPVVPSELSPDDMSAQPIQPIPPVINQDTTVATDQTPSIPDFPQK